MGARNSGSGYESPQMRRLRSDLTKMQALQQDSSVIQFVSYGQPAQRYMIDFNGLSLARDRGKVNFKDHHQVEIKLGVSYPRTMPEIRWLTPIYHPNISEIGLVCLGGYGTHWVPSLHLDDLCVMLWDMARYHNYDIRSPYNREAALWASNQTAFAFPTDARPLRDRRIALERLAPDYKPPEVPSQNMTDSASKQSGAKSVCVLDIEVDLRQPRPSPPPPPKPPEEIVFLD